MPPSNSIVAASLHHTAAVEEAASPLDDFLSGAHHFKYPDGFTISIPSSKERKLSLPAAMDMESEYEQKNEEGSCDESASHVSELTQMTYRAELKKQVSRKISLIL